MLIDNTTAAAFAEGHAVAARIRELLEGGDMSDPAIVAEVARLSAGMKPVIAKAVEIACGSLAHPDPEFRRTLELVGLTREEARKLADAFLAIYEDKPEVQA